MPVVKYAAIQESKRQRLIPFPRVGKRQALIPFPRTGKRSGSARSRVPEEYGAYKLEEFQEAENAAANNPKQQQQQTAHSQKSAAAESSSKKQLGGRQRAAAAQLPSSLIGSRTISKDIVHMQLSFIAYTVGIYRHVWA